MFNKIKKSLFAFAAVTALVLSLNVWDHFKPRPVEPMTIQRRSSHLIEYYQGTRRQGSCTGTVLGPHAILTATHCDERREVRDIRLDFSLRAFHIEKFLTDGNDHDIYLVDGPAFTNFVPYKVRPAKLGEQVYLFGSGAGQFPPRRLNGVRLAWDDPSDVDADAGIVRFSMPVILGDSGSAVFAQDGTIVAVTTYLFNEPYVFGFLEDTSTVDFIPSFTPPQIEEAVKFEPTAYVEVIPKSKAPTFPFSPFGFNFN